MNSSPTDPRWWPLSPTEAPPGEPAPTAKPLAEPTFEMPAVPAPPSPDPFATAPASVTTTPQPVPVAPQSVITAPQPVMTTPTHSRTTTPRPAAAPPPRTAAHPTDAGQPRKSHGGRLVAIGLAVLVLVGGSAAAVWRLNSHTATAPPLVSNNALPSTSEVAAVAPQASASGAMAALGTAAPQASQSSAAPSKAVTTGPPGPLIDNFTGTTLDTTKWDVYGSTSTNGGIWNSSAIRTTGGELQIVGTGTNATGSGNVAGGLCWCGTGGNRLYGTWQVRARFDAGAGYGIVLGLWPASNKGSADGYIAGASVPGAARTSMTGRVVWNGGNDPGTVTGDFTAWHTYTIEWRATYVRLSLDGKVFYDSTKSTASPVIPHVPEHLYMQSPIGPDGNVPAPNANTPAHVVMHFDWVKISP